MARRWLPPARIASSWSGRRSTGACWGIPVRHRNLCKAGFHVHQLHGLHGHPFFWRHGAEIAAGGGVKGDTTTLEYLSAISKLSAVEE